MRARVARLLVLVAVATATGVGRAVPARGDEDPFGPAKRPAGAASPPEEAPPPLELLRPWLAHEDWLCRALATRELEHRAEDGAVTLLAGALEREEDERVTFFLCRALAGRPRDDLLVEGGPALVERLLSLLAHPHPWVRDRALRALTPIPPVRLGTSPAAWHAWWPAGKAGLETERTLAIERRLTRRGAVLPSGVPAPAPGEGRTVEARSMQRYVDLDRIHREGLEVVVCLDSTGSMGNVIETAKANVRTLVSRLRRVAPRLRVGLVTYDDAATLRVPLTTDEAALEKELRKVVASGGDDPPEGVDKAIRLAYRQDQVAWSRKAQRVVIVVGDAPPHEEDVVSLMRFLDDPPDAALFEAPIRVDTISTAFEGGDVDGLGLVPHFAEIARRGHGSALRLSAARDLAAALVVGAFGPSWREPIRTLLVELDAFEQAAPLPPPGPRTHGEKAAGR